MIDIFLVAVMHAAAVGVIACLISESEIVTPARDLLVKWSPGRFKLLWHCPICLGFWLATPLLKYGISHYFLVVAVSNVWMLIILKVYESLE
jgi:hypothetical protein